MIAIICLDDNLGMMFNNRRQSRDAVLIKKINELTKDSVLWVSDYSSSLFSESSNVLIDEDFPSKAAESDFCFIENKKLSTFERKIEKIIVFKWNSKYPYDVTLDIDLSRWSLTASVDFAGKSHEKITMEVYSK